MSIVSKKVPLYINKHYQVVFNFVFETASWNFNRLVVIFVFFVVPIVGFAVLLAVLCIVLNSVSFNINIGFFIIIGRFGNCRIFVMLFRGMDFDVLLIDDISVVLFAVDFSILFIVDLLIVLFLTDFSVVFLITLVNSGGRVSVVITNGCGSSVQLLFVMTFDLGISTVLLATGFGVITTGLTSASGCACFFMIAPSE